MTLADLNSRFGIADQLTFIDGPNGLVFAEIDNALGSAYICLQGAHITTFRPKDQVEPVIWVSKFAKFAPGKSIRGGAPVCWPWFGAHATESSFPGHGFARTVMWEVTHSAALPGGETEITLALLETEQTHAQWPHKTRLELNVIVGKSLKASLNTSNLGDTPVQIGEALHTYFQIGDIEEVQVTGLENTVYLDKVGEVARKTQSGAITFNGEVDRVYVDTTATCTIVDARLNRRIVIAKTGSRSTVVWTPWTEKADKMGDFGPDGWRQMVCVESANALENGVTVAAGETHRMTVEYSAEAM
ncbi:MAG: D-hexose-6-phosphate mutarotase [Hydrogenophilales bacterium 28-61-23]|nr:MAG: D-hexose-6-phosphate mutarotase [Hydrogenophilales bacterium 28-61-23]